MDVLTSGFCVRLALARSVAGLSSHDLDRLAGLAEGHTSLLENGKRKPAGETAAKLAKALGCSTDWLLCNIGNGPVSR
jgi:transcriptional regulator with XRE-family HTH domain